MRLGTRLFKADITCSLLHAFAIDFSQFLNSLRKALSERPDMDDDEAVFELDDGGNTALLPQITFVKIGGVWYIDDL